MKNKVYNITKKLNIILTTLFLILSPIYIGSFKDSYINSYLFVFLILDFISILIYLLKPYKINKKTILYFLFILTFLLPLFSKDIIFINTHIKITILVLSTIILSININNIFKENVLYKILITSSTLTSIISILYIFYPTFFENIYIHGDYGDFFLSSIYRLYGTLNYPNCLAIFSLIGIILSIKYIDKNIFKITFYINLLTLFLTISKSTIIFAIIVFIIYIIINKNIRQHLIASIIPIMLNLNTTRISIINDNILFLIITTALLILLYFIFYTLLNKKPLITYIIIILIIILSIIYPTNTLTIEKDNNEDIFIVDFIGLKSGTYEIDIKLDSDNYNGNIYLYKQFMQNHNLSYILIKQESLKDNIKIKFKVEKNAEYYSLKISNNLMNFKIKSIELTKGKNKKEIPVNYYLLPYNYIKQLEQLKYDGTSIDSRLEIYKLCLEIIKDNPLLGHGFDYFKIANKNTNINYILVEHSQIMTLGVQNGIISIIIWIVLLITIIIEIIKKRSIKNLELNIIIILLIYTSLFDFTMSYHFFLLLFFIFCNYLFTKKAL